MSEGLTSVHSVEGLPSTMSSKSQGRSFADGKDTLLDLLRTHRRRRRSMQPRRSCANLSRSTASSSTFRSICTTQRRLKSPRRRAKTRPNQKMMTLNPIPRRVISPTKVSGMRGIWGFMKDPYTYRQIRLDCGKLEGPCYPCLPKTRFHVPVIAKHASFALVRALLLSELELMYTREIQILPVMSFCQC